VVKVNYAYCVTKERAWRILETKKIGRKKGVEGSILEKLCAAKLAVTEKPSTALKLSKLCIIRVYCPCRQAGI
jgi:hypothetical protein